MEEIDLSFISITNPTDEAPRFQILLFGKETVKMFFYKCSNSGINESTPQTRSNVSWISNKAELEISFLKIRSWKKLRESGPKIGSQAVTGVSS